MRNAGPMSRKVTGLVARSIAGVVLGAFFAAQTPTGLAQTAAPMPDAGAESRKVAEAFSRLNALAEELAEQQGRIAQEAGGVPPPAPPPPGPVPAPQAPSNGGPRPAPSPSGSVPSETSHCDPLEEITETIREVEERYGEYSDAIVEVNSRLPDFREGMLDPVRVCERRFGDDIGHEIGRLKELDILRDQRHVDGIGVCVDQLRRETDKEMGKEGITTIRLQRLAARLEQLTDINHQIINLQEALVRGNSKRDRLIQELDHFHEEVKETCQ